MTHGIPVYLLAGGRSRRFGSDKARALLHGVPLIVRLARQLEAVAGEIIVVADRAGRYADLGLHTIADVEPGLGPVGGLRTALSDLKGEWLLLGSCDLLLVRPAWVRTLLDARHPNAHAVAFRDRAGQRWQPFPGLYHESLLSEVEARLQAGDRRMQALLDAANSVGVPLPADWPAIAQANTPDDLAQAASDP